MARERERPSFNYFKKWLRQHFPSQYSVRILLINPAKLNEKWGCPLDGLTHQISTDQVDRFIIYLSNSLNINQTVETLMHEWCHVLCGHTTSDIAQKSHDDLFFAHYGKIYRKWHEEE